MVTLKTLVVVDMQNDFVTGSYGTEEAKAIVGRVQSIMEDYIEEGDSYTNIICTQDTHFIDTWKDNVESNYLLPHCLVETEGMELVGPVKQLVETNPDEIKVINKFTYGSVKVAESIKEYYDYISRSLNEEGVPLKHIDLKIEIVGLCTDICVISNALIIKAMIPYADITINAWGCAGTTVENHKKALDIMKLNGIEVVGE